MPYFLERLLSSVSASLTLSKYFFPLIFSIFSNWVKLCCSVIFLSRFFVLESLSELSMKLKMLSSLRSFASFFNKFMALPSNQPTFLSRWLQCGFNFLRTFVQLSSKVASFVLWRAMLSVWLWILYFWIQFCASLELTLSMTSFLMVYLVSSSFFVLTNNYHEVESGRSEGLVARCFSFFSFAWKHLE